MATDLLHKLLLTLGAQSPDLLLLGVRRLPSVSEEHAFDMGVEYCNEVDCSFLQLISRAVADPLRMRPASGQVHRVPCVGREVGNVVF